MYNMENMDTLDIFLFLYGGVGYTPNHLWISQWTGESEENQWDDSFLCFKWKRYRGSFTYAHGNGEPRKPAFAERVIGTSIVFSQEYAVLHV